jgi:hypothetical protein
MAAPRDPAAALARATETLLAAWQHVPPAVQAEVALVLRRQVAALAADLAGGPAGEGSDRWGGSRAAPCRRTRAATCWAAVGAAQGPRRAARPAGQGERRGAMRAQEAAASPAALAPPDNF